MNSPIYLHIFDRELRTLVGAQFSDEYVCDVVILASLISPKIYVGLSNLMESMLEFPKAVKLVCDLEKLDCALIVTTTHSPEEFFESRRRLYHVDKDRYPMYFDNSHTILTPMRQFILKESTTSIIERSLIHSLDRPFPEIEEKRKDLKSAIINRDDGGITSGIINKRVPLVPFQRKVVGRMISHSYNERYLNALDGCLLKFLHGIHILDDISKGYFFYNIYKSVIVNLVTRFWNEFEMEAIPFEILRLRGDESFIRLMDKLNKLVSNLMKWSKEKNGVLIEATHSVNCELIVNRHLVPLLKRLASPDIAQADCFFDEAIGNIEKDLNTKLNMEEETNVHKLLYVVATDTEFAKVYKYYKEKNGNTPGHIKIGRLIYQDLGIIGNSHVYLLKSGKGAKGSGGSILTIDRAIEDLQPAYIIMVGIAFGLDEENQKYNDIMVSSAIEDYGTFKIKNGEIIERGDHITSNEILINRFDNSKLTWDKCQVHTGLIITNDVLVDDPDYVTLLKSCWPDAIGGEMEGCGLLAHPRVPWILVKAICDYGYHKNDEHQGDAAMNAIEYVDYTIREFPL